MSDLISRQAAIDKINERQRKLIYCFGFENDMVKIMDIAKSIITAIPPVQPDLSEYSDKLWKSAYERGKAEARHERIRCRDCKYWRDDHTCHEHSLVSPMCANEYCSRAERRTE